MAFNEKNDATHVEVDGLSPTITGVTIAGKELQQTVADATNAEHDLPVRETLRLYKLAFFRSLIFQMYGTYH